MKEKWRGKLIVLLVAFGFTFLLYSNTAKAQYYDYVSGSSAPYISIPDNAGEFCGDWAYDGITFPGISSRAYVTSVDVSFTIVHSRLLDLIVDLQHPDNVTEYRVWEVNGTQSPYSKTGITTFNNLSVNGKWDLWVSDCYQPNSGYLESWNLTVYYTIPPPSAPTGLFVTGTGDGEVSLSWNANPEDDCNGYYIQWDTLPTVSKTSYIAWVWLEGRFNTNWTVNPSPYGLFNGKLYYFVVTATDIYNNESSESNRVSGTPRESTTPDDPYSVWVPAHYANYTNEGRSTSVIDTIVIHVAQGYYQSTIDLFKNWNDRNVSAHYVIGSNGAITQMVHHNDRAHHAFLHNARTIGIEHEGFTNTPDYFTPAMYKASGDLVKYICDLYGIPKDRNHVVGHSELGTGSPDPGQYWDWDVYMGHVTTVKEITSPKPISSYQIFQNFPNPFNSSTAIKFQIPRRTRVELYVYNILGKKVKTLCNDFLGSGAYIVTWDGTNESNALVASGVYFYRICTENYEETKKMTFLK